MDALQLRLRADLRRALDETPDGPDFVRRFIARAEELRLCPECNLPANHEPSPENCLAALDAKYHDHLPEGANCHLCGIEHAAINPR